MKVDEVLSCFGMVISAQSMPKLCFEVFEKDVYQRQANPIVKGQYQTAENPIFEVFYLEEPHGVIADFSGNPPYEF